MSFSKNKTLITLQGKEIKMFFFICFINYGM